MPFFQNAQHVNIHGCTFSETYGDQNIYNGSVYNLDSYNSTSTETRGSYNDSSTNLRGTKRYNGDKVFNPTSPRKGGAQDRYMKHASTAFGAQHRQSAAFPSTTQWKQTHHKPPSSRSTNTYPNIAEARRLRTMAAEMRRVHLEDAPRRGDFGAPREVDQDFSDEGSDAGMGDDAEAEIWDLEDDQRFSSPTPSTSATTPFTSPSPAFNSSSPAGSARASRNSQPQHTNPFAQMTQTQQDRNTHQAMYYGGVWNNSSNNNTSNATHDSHNDSSIRIIESD